MAGIPDSDAVQATLTKDVEAVPEISPTAIVIANGRDRRILDVADYPEVAIGRAAEATVTIDDASVSRLHVRFTHRDGQIFVEDLGSRNGTTLNGKPLQKERQLSAGDELVVGPAVVTLLGRRGAKHGILNEDELFERAAAEIERAELYRRPLSLIGLAMTATKESEPEAWSRVKARLRNVDFIGEYAAAQYVVVLPEMVRSDGEKLAQELDGFLREVVGVASATRVASVPEDGTTLDETMGALFGVAVVAAADVEASFVAEDAATVKLFETARRVARSGVNVLVVGETGAGKELVSAELHRASERHAGPHVRLNCAALPETLLESELFGHEKGAFTGADRQRIGRIEAAEGGTLMLDEIGELPMPMQAKLLRVLEDRRVVRVGGNRETAVDVRFVAATNRDLEEEVRAGRFRQDLLFRLNAITLEVPPLRTRPRDLQRLAERFSHAAAVSMSRATPQLSPELLDCLLRYDWPGNVRELKNVMERAVILSDSAKLEPKHLPDRVRRAAKAAAPAPTGPMWERVDEVERRELQAALEATGRNRTHAAARLGISRRALLYKMKKLGIT